MNTYYTNGGLQFVPPQSTVQYIYLDFDGELTNYNGETLTIDNVVVQNSALSKERISSIVEELNTQYANSNVIFTTTRPKDIKYSTIYIGKTTAFNQYGNFSGVAETIDFNNSNANDNAFVLLDESNSNNDIISTIAHETEHLLGKLNHGGNGLETYAHTSGGIILSDESLDISNGETSSYITINKNASINCKDGGIVNSTRINDGGRMNLSEGGTANDTTITSGGNMYISSGGIANDTTVSSGGSMHITSQGIGSNTTINDGGKMYISSGGTANDTTISSGGSIDISSGGVINNTTISSGANINILNGTIANDTIIYSDGSINISSGGTANDTIVSSGGKIYISSKGIANDTIIYSDGSINISSGGTANDTIIYSDGSINISSGGTANDTTIKTEGKLTINNGGIHTGSLFIEKNAIVSVGDGGKIDFTVSQSNVQDGYLINNLSLISGSPTYRITINTNQEHGIYKLAQGAEKFSGSILITNTININNYITVNDNDLIINDITYSIDNIYGNLILTIKENDIIPPDVDYVFVNSKYNEKTTGKKQNNIKLTYGDNAFNNVEDAVEAVKSLEDTTNVEVILLDSKNNGDFCIDIPVVAGVISNITEKKTNISYSLTETYTAKNTIEITQNTRTTKFKRFATVNVNGGTVDGIIGGKFSSTKEDKTSVAKKGTITTTLKDNYSGSATGKFTATNSATINIVENYSTVEINSASVGNIIGGKFSSNNEEKTVDGLVVLSKSSSSKNVAGKFTATNATINIVENYSTVNVNGGIISKVIVRKFNTNEETKNSVDKKGTITTTLKDNYSGSATGKFTATNTEISYAVTGYLTVNLTNSFIKTVSAGNTKINASSKIVDAQNKYQKTVSIVDDKVAAGSITLKDGAKTNEIIAFANVTLTNATAGNISNFTSKDSKSETATFDDNKNTVTRKVTLSHTENSTGTLKATNVTSLGDVTGFATVTLKDVETAGNFKRVDENGKAYSTVKETLNVKTNKDKTVTATYTKTETFTRNGKFTATNSNIGDIVNYNTVTLIGSVAHNITNIVESKATTKVTLNYDSPNLYGKYSDFSDFQLGIEIPDASVQQSLSGSVTLKNNSTAKDIENFKTLTLEGSSVEDISNVTQVKVNKNINTITSYIGTENNDTLTISKNAVLIAQSINLGSEAKDTINLTGTLILTGTSVIATKITGKGEIVATSDVYKNLDINFANVLDLGETTTNFKGTTFESSDNTLKKAAKWDPATQYDGWMGSWNDGTKEGSDAVDFIKFKANIGDTLVISNIIEGNWTLFNKKGIEVTDVNIFDNNTNTFLASGEYILQLTNTEVESISYSVKLA